MTQPRTSVTRAEDGRPVGQVTNLPYHMRDTGRGWTLVEARRLAPALLARLPRVDGLPAPNTWVIQRARRTGSGRLALWVGPREGRAAVLVKLAQSGGAAAALKREQATLASLWQRPELQAWRAWLPEVIADGEIEGRYFRAERALDGVAASDLQLNPPAYWRAHGTAATSIRRLHEQTLETITVDERMLDRWLARPLAVLRGSPWVGLWPGVRRALDRIERALRAGFAGQVLQVSWVHGDYWAGNILVTPDGSSLTGIVDWDMAGPAELPARDALHLVLYGRRLLCGEELGDRVRAVLKGSGFGDEERAVLEAAEVTIPRSPEHRRVWVGEYWLRHVADHLSQDARNGWNGWWVFKNVVRVLQCF